MIATSVIDNGVSIEDKALKNVVIDSTEEVEFMQMLGRKRWKDGEIINLFVKNKTEKGINDYWNYTKAIISNIDLCNKNPNEFENKIVDKNFVGSVYFQFNPDQRLHLPCAYAATYLSRIGSELFALYSDLSNNENTFAKQVCKWLDKDFSVSMIDQTNSYTKMWHKIETILASTVKDYLLRENIKIEDPARIDLRAIMEKIPPDKPIVTKEALKTYVKEMVDIITPIKHGSGINIDKNNPVSSANSILNFFYEQGFDKYKFSGRTEYFLTFEPNENEKLSD